MNANFLRSCGLAALLALSAVAEPAPVAQPAQTVKKAPVADRITSNDDEPIKKPAAPAPVKPAAPPLVNQKGSADAVLPSEVKLTDKPAAATPAPAKVTEAPVAKPAAATPAPSKITEDPVAKPAAATPTPAKVTEVPAAKPAAATPAPSKITEAPVAKPAAATPAPSKITEAPAVKPAAATPAASKITEAPVAKPVTATPVPAKVTEVPVAKPVTATPAPVKVTEAPAVKPAAATPAASKITDAPVARPAAATPAPAKVTEVPAAKPGAAAAKPAPGTKPVVQTKPAAAPLLTENLEFPQAKTELKRLMIGNQAGIVKVLGPNREGVSYVRGIDDKNIARFSDDACGSIFCALGISHDKLNKVAVEIMTNYSTLPRKEAVAFLGAVVASAHLTPEVDAKAEEFLVQVMETDKDVHARRQSVLALAVKHNVKELTTEHVLALYEHSENLWETFPVQQYFEYHAGQVKRLENFVVLRERIAAVKSLYTPAILAALDGTKPVTVAP